MSVVILAQDTTTLTLPRKRERGGAAFREISANIFSVRHKVFTLRALARHNVLPLPLVGEGWGGGAQGLNVVMDDEDKPSWKVTPRLRTNARALRKNSTDAERLLWAELRDHRLNSLSFRRQVPIDHYVADFVCHSAKLVIEIDGGQHYSGSHEQKDALRTTALKAHGFRVLRFSNHDVLNNRAGVLETIIASIPERAPTLTLPRKREREQGTET